ncbi:hypothetical protein IFM89_002826 [Coptis chinensis]|uniref:rhamnogalacturonan endolyase n=1 Tax=Coptis chinensis TaxID=261450 RepID=A0A835LYI2_9MAGN|nr:hypothetical protein IFM89_002826 [Coptis chinensis]
MFMEFLLLTIYAKRLLDFYLNLRGLLYHSTYANVLVGRTWRWGAVVMDNGLVQVTLSKPEGIVTGIRYNGINNLLEMQNPEDERGYWDISWNEPGMPGKFDIIKGRKFRIIMQNESQAEVSFTRTWSPSQQGSLVPLNIDKRFIMLQGSHGFYSYSIYEHLEGWPDFDLGVTRLTFKLRKDMFRYMAVDERRQRRMPLPDDRMSRRSQILAYPEAVRIVKPTETQFQGEVDDKYQYSSDSEDIKVHGWTSTKPLVGFWHITPSYEFRSGGPFKQELTSHVGPTTLTAFYVQVFISPHYMGQEGIPKFRNGEAWKKVFGPVFVYLNSGPPGTKRKTLWKDADNQMRREVQNWPYSFPLSNDFPKSEQRGLVYGRLLVRDRFFSLHIHCAHMQNLICSFFSKFGYQFWTKSDTNGLFTVKNIRPGIYNLYASVPGFIGDYKYDKIITIRPGDNIDLGDLIYTPPRTGPTLWEIGYPDRTAIEFFIPEPNPHFVNPLYLQHDRFRQYGLWEEYSRLYPNEDLTYTINASDYRKDWFFAQVTRITEDNSYDATTWKIRFNIHNVGQNATYTLRLALASAAFAELQVRFNDLNMNRPHFTTGLIGRDNAIARHGIHGMYWLFNVDVKSDWLVEGGNVIFLTQARNSGPFVGVMYDYIRFEGSPASS